MRQEHREHRKRLDGDMSPAPRIGRRTALTALGFTMLLPGSLLMAQDGGNPDDTQVRPQLPDNKIKLSTQTVEFFEGQIQGEYATEEITLSVWTNGMPWALVGWWEDDGPGIGNGSHSLPPGTIYLDILGKSGGIVTLKEPVPLIESVEAVDGKEVMKFRLLAKMDPLTSPDKYVGRVVFNILNGMEDLAKNNSQDRKKPPEVDVKYVCDVKSFTQISVEGELKFGSVLPGEHLCPELATITLNSNLDAVNVSGTLSSMMNGGYSIPTERITIVYGYTENEARSNLAAAYYGIQGFDATLNKQAPKLYIAAKTEILISDPPGLYKGVLVVSAIVGQ